MDKNVPINTADNCNDKHKNKSDSISNDIATFDGSSKREPQYTQLLTDIVNDNHAIHYLKITFFIVIMLTLVGICFGVVAILILLSLKPTISAGDIGVVVGGAVSLLSTIIVLPQIMAKHIFPANSERERFKFVNEMQRVDRNINNAHKNVPAEFFETAGIEL